MGAGRITERLSKDRFELRDVCIDTIASIEQDVRKTVSNQVCIGALQGKLSRILDGRCRFETLSHTVADTDTRDDRDLTQDTDHGRTKL